MQLISHPSTGPVASPTPMLLAPEDPGTDASPIVLETHLGAPHQVLVIAWGEHGYISPSWYVGADRGQVPTWNFEQATLKCDVEVLGAQENLETLQRLVAHFEQAYAPEDGIRLDIDDDGNRGMAMGTVGLRLTVRSFEAKSKMSQNKSPETRASVLARLDASNPRLAARMRLAESAEADACSRGD